MTQRSGAAKADAPASARTPTRAPSDARRSSPASFAVLGALVLGLSVVALGPSDVRAEDTGSPVDQAATTTLPPAITSTTPPKSAVQTGAGTVRVLAPLTKGAKRLRLLQDGVVVLELRFAGPGARPFDRTSLSVGTHTFSLQAGNASGWGPESSTVSVDVVDVPAAVNTPTLAEVNDTTMSVTFPRVSGAGEYAVLVNGIERATTRPKPGVDPVVVKVGKLAVASPYAVTVSGSNVAGPGPSSASASLTLYPQMKKVAPPTVSDGTVQTAAGVARVVAKLTPGATTYALLVDEALSGATPTVGASTVTFTVPALSTGDHDFAIRVTNARYTTTSKSLRLELLPAPSSASGVTVTQTTDTSVRVAFDPGNSARTSKVYLDGVLAAEVKVPKGATTTSATIKSLVALSSHSITVVSSNVVGSAAASAPLAFTLYPTLAATIGQPAASQTVPNTVRITIPTTPNATKYALVQDGVAVQEATASGGSVVFDVADLVEGRLYTFTVVAKNPRMSAPASRFVGVTVFAIVDVAPDVSLDTQYDPGNVAAVAVTFSQLTGTDGYRIYVDGVLAAARAASIPFVGGEATVTVNMTSTTSHVVRVCGYTGAGEGPRSTPITVDPAP